MSKAVPRKAFAPDLVVKLSTPPEVLPNSAGIVEVVTLNSFIASTEGAFSSKVEPSSACTMLAPSRITSVLKFCPPASLDSKIPDEGESLLVPGPAVPGVKKTNDSVERKWLCPVELRANGSSSICLLSTTVPISDDSVCRPGASATTVIVSFTSPGCSEKSNEEVELICTTTPVFSTVLKPAADTATLYTATRRSKSR